ncbi:MAG: permease, partial [Clostridia bacterium]|nr:permease [Clostridia bacterium]
YVKWWPYYHRILTVAATHRLGTSIFGSQGHFASASLAVAWEYTVKYFRAVWQAAILGIILGGAVEALLPTVWVRRYLYGRGFRSTLLAGIASLPGMMCSCCATPVVVGLRRRNASTGAALAFWLGNPVLNPATLTVLFLVLGWKFGLLRLIFGATMVFGVSYWLERAFQDENRPPQAAPAPVERTSDRSEHWSLRWLKASGRLAAWIVPEYLGMVLLTGFLGGYFFPGGIGSWAHTFPALVLIALAGTLFVIPTMAEIPIVQGLMAIGLAPGPAAALLLTLPAISLPSLIMLGRSFHPRTLVAVTLAATLVGTTAGLAAMALF